MRLPVIDNVNVYCDLLLTGGPLPRPHTRGSNMEYQMNWWPVQHSVHHGNVNKVSKGIIFKQMTRFLFDQRYLFHLCTLKTTLKIQMRCRVLVALLNVSTASGNRLNKSCSCFNASPDNGLTVKKLQKSMFISNVYNCTLHLDANVCENLLSREGLHRDTDTTPIFSLPIILRTGGIFPVNAEFSGEHLTWDETYCNPLNNAFSCNEDCWKNCCYDEALVWNWDKRQENQIICWWQWVHWLPLKICIPVS